MFNLSVCDMGDKLLPYKVYELHLKENLFVYTNSMIVLYILV